jgi:hypothetical protein
MQKHTGFVSAIPPDPGEEAAAAMRWERRGLLRRLVRVDDPGTVYVRPGGRITR